MLPPDPTELSRRRTARALSDAEIFEAFRRCSGLIPIDIDVPGRRLFWRDMGAFHCYEGFFHESLALLSAFSPNSDEIFSTELETLRRLDLSDSLRPRAFIFHAGRCGSTLMAKALARSRANMVFSEAASHNRIWEVLEPSEPDAVPLYAQLLVAMGRKRLPEYKSHIVKFTSFNILHYDFIRSAFPHVPALFLCREPGALLESYQRTPPAWMEAPPAGVTRSAEGAIRQFFQAAAEIHEPLFRRLDYSRLTPQSLPDLLAFLQIEVPDADLRLMRNEFLWDSKASLTPSPFRPRKAVLPAPQDLADLHVKLLRQSEADWE